jgi:hypothetical protein
MLLRVEHAGASHEAASAPLRSMLPRVCARRQQTGLRRADANIWLLQVS